LDTTEPNSEITESNQTNKSFAASTTEADAFISNPQQFTTFFSKMMNSFSYQKIVTDSHGKPVDYIYLYVNDAFEKHTGLKRENIIGRKATEVPPGIKLDPAGWIEIYGKVALTGQPVKSENYVETLDKWFEVTAYSPKKGYFVTISEDISTRKKVEEALLSKENELASIYASVPEALFFLSVEGESSFRFLSVSKSFLRITGLRENQVVGKSVQEVIPEPSLSLVLEKYAQAIRECKTIQWEEVTNYPSGRKYGEVAVTPFFDSSGCCTNLAGSVYDITERKKMEQDLSKSLEESRRRESEISALLKASRAVLQNREFPDSARAIFDACKEILGATAGYVALLSDDGKENIVMFLDSGGLPCTVDPSLPMPIRGLRAEAYNSGKIAIENDFPQSEWQEFSPKGHMRLENVLFAPLKIEQRTVGVIGLANKPGGFNKRDAEMAVAFGDLVSIALANSKMLEILEENQKQLKMHSEHLEMLVEERTKKLELSALYARNLIEASLDPLVTINVDGKITDVNKATELATGCSRKELIGSDFSDYFVETEKAKSGYKRVFAEGVVKDYPLAIKHRNGRITNVLYNATVYRNNAGEIQGVFAAARDITEQKKAEAETQEAAKKLKDSERLAAIGATAGMVGHDIRNPLQAITGDLYLAKTELAALPETEQKTNTFESLEEIEHNIDYINKIVADLQDYARPLNPRTQETDVESVFNEVLGKNGIPKNIKVSVDVEDKAKKIIADPDYLKRIAANLTLNAIQAMPEGGKLTIRAYCDKQTNCVLITVKDTGVGIPEDIKPKLFTPMMTTKSKGQGFGLAVVKRMTEGLGGTVTFESTEGKGTTFTVRLPPPKEIKGKWVFK
jgi:PAS domain S-box-containing protein